MLQYLLAFMALDRRRQSGYAMAQPLSTEAILLYALTHGFRSDLRFFCKIISELDDDFIKQQNEKQKAKAPKKTPKGKRK